jgi:hypothetical protein
LHCAAIRQSVVFTKTLDVFFADSLPAGRPHDPMAGSTSLTSSDAPEQPGPLDRIAERAGVETNLILQIYRMDEIGCRSSWEAVTQACL